MSVYKRAEFLDKYKDVIFVKLTNQQENHNDFQYQTGLNIDTLTFNPTSECESGGLYFCSLDKLYRWLRYGDKKMYYVRFVSFPEDVLIYEEEHSFKASSLILSERQVISELKIWEDNKYCLEAVKRDGSTLEYVRNQTEEICLKAVKQYGLALQYVLDQTDEICLKAIKRHDDALKYVKNQTEAICLEAVKQNGNALQFVKDQTDLICMESVKQNGLALEYAKYQTEEICMEAVKQNGCALRFVINQTYESCFEAVRQNGNALESVLDQSNEICLEAVKQNGYALRYVRNLNVLPLCLEIVKHNKKELKYVKNQTDDIFKKAVKQCESSWKHIWKQLS